MNVNAVLSHRRALPAVVAIFLLLGLCNLGSLPFFDPDEAFYPATARESAEWGNVFDLRLNGEPRWAKPPLAYVVQWASMLVLGENEFAARLPSLLAGALLVLLVGRAAAAVASPRAGAIAGAVLAGSLGFGVLARAAHPEILLTLAWMAAWTLLMIEAALPPEKRSSRTWWWAGVALGLGFLVKGPLVLLLPWLGIGATTLLRPRDRAWLGHAARVLAKASLLGLALAAPWFLWMLARHGAPFRDAVLAQLGHATSSEFEHGDWTPLYFVPILAVAFFPWIGLLPECFRGASRTDPSPSARVTTAALATAGAAFLWFSLSRAQLPHYSVAFLPPLALVAGLRLDAVLDEDPRARLRALVPCAVLAGLLFVAFALAPVAGPGLFTGLFPKGVDAFDLLVVASTSGAIPFFLLPPLLVLIPKEERRAAALLPLLLAFGMLLPFSGMLVAGAVDPFIRPPVKRWIDEEPEGERWAVYRKRLPSMSFYSKGEVSWPHDAEELRAWAMAGPGNVLIHERHLRTLFVPSKRVRTFVRAQPHSSWDRSGLRQVYEFDEVPGIGDRIPVFRSLATQGRWHLLDVLHIQVVTPEELEDPFPTPPDATPPGEGR